MRSISFALTTEQFLNGTKDVTRRLGWANLKPGTRLMGCRKCMGLKPGEALERLRVIEVVSVRREPLEDIGTYAADCRREGFPDLTPLEFVQMFCRHMQREPETIVTRIEFRHLWGVPCWKGVDFDECPECGDVIEALTTANDGLVQDGDSLRCLRCDWQGAVSVDDYGRAWVQ